MEAAPNKRSYVRLSAMGMLLLGHERKSVCQIFGRTDHLVRLWIELFNRGSIDALITRPKPGRPRKVKLERVRDLLILVLQNPAEAGQVHWTGVKMHGYLKDKLVMQLGYRTAIRWLHELNFHCVFHVPGLNDRTRKNALDSKHGRKRGRRRWIIQVIWIACVLDRTYECFLRQSRVSPLKTWPRR